MNTDIDKEVLIAIQNSPGITLAGISARCPAATTDREVDRSLQRLRKRKLIEYGGPGTTFTGWRAKRQSTP